MQGLKVGVMTAPNPFVWIKGKPVMTEPQRRRASDLYPPRQPWHLDKSVPIGLIVAILAQSFAAVFFAATLIARVENLEDRAADTKDNPPRLLVVESQLKDIKDTLRRIETNLRPGP
jgi:hypothetical protein